MSLCLYLYITWNNETNEHIKYTDLNNSRRVVNKTKNVTNYIDISILFPCFIRNWQKCKILLFSLCDLNNSRRVVNKTKNVTNYIDISILFPCFIRNWQKCKILLFSLCELGG